MTVFDKNNLPGPDFKLLPGDVIYYGSERKPVVVCGNIWSRPYWGYGKEDKIVYFDGVYAGGEPAEYQIVVLNYLATGSRIIRSQLSEFIYG